MYIQADRHFKKHRSEEASTSDSQGGSSSAVGQLALSKARICRRKLRARARYVGLPVKYRVPFKGPFLEVNAR